MEREEKKKGKKKKDFVVELFIGILPLSGGMVFLFVFVVVFL